jgi:hypothetical protein
MLPYFCLVIMMTSIFMSHEIFHHFSISFNIYWVHLHTSSSCTREAYTATVSYTISCRIWGFHSSGFVKFCILGFKFVHSVESQEIFRSKMSPKSSASKNKAEQETRAKQVAKVANRVLGLFFEPAERGWIFLRKVGWLPTDYTTLYPRIWNSSTEFRLSWPYCTTLYWNKRVYMQLTCG